MTPLLDAVRYFCFVACFLLLALVRWALGATGERVVCPDGYDLRTGVPPSGLFLCWPHPVGDPNFDGTWRHEERSIQPAGAIPMQIVCREGRHPVVLLEPDGRADRAVGCAR